MPEAPIGEEDRGSDAAGERHDRRPELASPANVIAVGILRTDREEREAFLLRLSDALRPLSDPLDVQEVAARLLGEHLRVNRVGYAQLEDRAFVIRREYISGVAPLAGHRAPGGFAAALRPL